MKECLLPEQMRLFWIINSQSEVPCICMTLLHFMIKHQSHRPDDDCSYWPITLSPWQSPFTVSFEIHMCGRVSPKWQSSSGLSTTCGSLHFCWAFWHFFGSLFWFSVSRNLQCWFTLTTAQQAVFSSKGLEKKKNTLTAKTAQYNSWATVWSEQIFPPGVGGEQKSEL